MKKQISIVSLLGLLACTAAARAEDQTIVSTAREIAKQAFQAYDEGRFEEAAEKSLKAYQVVRVPALAVIRARALVKLGKLVAASELYLEAVRTQRDPAWLEVQDEAVRNAERERAELLPRIPRLIIKIEGADSAQVAVSVDGTKVPAVLLGSEQMADPGEHTVVGSIGQQEAREVVAPKEGEQLQVTLKFAAAQTVAAVAGTADMPQTLYVEPKKPMSTMQLLGWTGVGLGGAGVIFGVIEGLNAKSKRSSLYDTGLCSPDGTQCDPSLSDRVDSYRTARTLSTVGLYAGGIIAAAGVTLLVLPSKKESQPRVGLLLGPSFVGIRGEML